MKYTTPDDVIEQAARDMSAVWRSWHTDEALGFQRMLTAAVAPIIARAALKAARDKIIEVSPKPGAEILPNGREDPMMSAYIDGLRTAWQALDEMIGVTTMHRRCETCEGSGVYVMNSEFPIPCPGCNGTGAVDE